MKKAVFLIAGVLLAAVFMTACGRTNNAASPSPSPNVAVTATASPETIATPAASATPSAVPDNGDGSSVTPPASGAPGADTATNAPAASDAGGTDANLQTLVSQLQSTYDGASNDTAKYSITSQGNNVILTIQILALDTAADAGDSSTYASMYDGMASTILSELRQVSSSATLTLNITADDNSVIYTNSYS